MAWFTFFSKTYTTKSGKRINVLWGMLAVAAVLGIIFFIAERTWGPF